MSNELPLPLTCVIGRHLGHFSQRQEPFNIREKLFSCSLTTAEEALKHVDVHYFHGKSCLIAKYGKKHVSFSPLLCDKDLITKTFFLW